MVSEITKFRIKRLLIVAAITAAVLAGINLLTGTQWMLFYDAGISGTVIDAETGKPIDGTIVVGLWRLSEFPGEGFGGYSKVSMVKTDKDGKFTIPFWVTFKPWKFYMYLHELVPEIAIYKPGYRFHWSHKISRAGFPGDISKTAEEKRILKEKHSIEPAKLKRIRTDEERLANYDDWEVWARFPDWHFSKRQIAVIADALKEDVARISQETEKKHKLLLYLDTLK